ncbi:MAG: hypothetical protein P8013_10005 [Candidatus Sulfobium sp.]|jgi:hypothetical protein
MELPVWYCGTIDGSVMLINALYINLAIKVSHFKFAIPEVVIGTQRLASKLASRIRVVGENGFPPPRE